MGCSKEISRFLFALVCFLFAGCSKSADPTLLDKTPVREHAVVSGPIVADAVWESGKEYVVTGHVTVEVGATLTIQPDVVVKFTPLEKARSFRAEILRRNNGLGGV